MMMMMEIMMTTETLIFLYVILCQHNILFTRVKSDQQKQMIGAEMSKQLTDRKKKRSTMDSFVGLNDFFEQSL